MTIDSIIIAHACRRQVCTEIDKQNEFNQSRHERVDLVQKTGRILIVRQRVTKQLKDQIMLWGCKGFAEGWGGAITGVSDVGVLREYGE